MNKTYLGEAINSHIFNLKDNMKTSIPCKVVGVNTEGDYITSVNIQPVVDRLYSDGLIVEAGIVYNVPVQFPSCQYGILSFPINVGDHVLGIFCHNDIQRWLSSGSRGVPSTQRKFSFTDAVAIPCIQPNTSDIKPHKDNLNISFNDFSLSVTPFGDVNLKTNSNIYIDAENSTEEVSEGYSVTASRVTIGNGNVDLVSYLSSLTDAISAITVEGVPIDNLADFVSLKTEIDELK